MPTTLPATSTDSEELFHWLTTHRPTVAWPTMLLFLLFVGGLGASSWAALQGHLPLPLAVLFNSIACYVSYTVLHEASHGLACTHRGLNDWIGRISLLGVTVTPFFRTYRFLHMTHHRFTNDPVKDPDHFCGAGPAWTLPLRWMVMDVAYVSTYFRPSFYSARPLKEKIEFWLANAFGVGLVVTVLVMGWIEPFLWLYFIPTRIALFALAITFDYLPHFPHGVRAEHDRYRATNVRIGHEWLLSPLFIAHNYHLAHHLYPTAPFYRYRRIWQSRQSFHEARGAAIVDGFGLSPRPQPIGVGAPAPVLD